MTFIRRNAAALAILLALPLLLLFPALLPGKALLPAAMLGNMLPWKGTAAFASPSPWNPLQFDGIAQFYPWRRLASEIYHSGYLPLWNPYQFCGTPLLANDQSATLYPLNILFLILPVAKAFGVSAVLHLFLAGVFLYAFLLRRLPPTAALLGAIIWQLSSWQVGWLELPTFVCTSAWIPLALLMIERCAEKPTAPGRGVGLGAVLGVMMLAGHLQVAFYGILICAAYGLTLLFGEAQREARGKLLASFLLAAGLMALICAPQLLPTVELSRVSHRAGAAANMGGYAGYTRLAMPAFRLVTLLDPSFFGGSADYWGGAAIPYAETACFVSVAGLLLAWIAVVAVAGKRGVAEERLRARFFAAAAGVSLLLALGTPLDMLFYFGIPGFAQTGSPARVLVLWTLSLAILAAYGLDALQKRQLAPKPAIYLTLASTLLPLVGAVLFLQQKIGPEILSRIDRVQLALSIGLLLVALSFASAATRPRFAPKAGLAFCALVACDLLRAGIGYNPAASLDQIYPVTPSISWLQAHIGAGRVVAVNSPNAVYEGAAVLPPNAATVYHLRDLQGYDSLQTGRYKTFLNQLNGGAESSPQENGNMALTHVYAAVGDQKIARQVWWTPAGYQAGAVFAVGPAPPGAAGRFPYSDDSVAISGQPTYFPRIRTALKNSIWPATAVVDVRVDSPDELVMNTRETGDLVVEDQWYPGWRVWVNGKPAAIEAKPDVFRTVENVPAGAHVRMRFEPDSLRLGVYLLCIGLCACVAAAAGSAAATSARRA